jgi:glucose-6-phosphate isomerase
VTFAIEPGPVRPAFEEACRRLLDRRFSEALWAHRLDVWSGDADIQRKIGDRLGWLDAADAMRPHIPRLRTFAYSVRDAGFTDVVLLGMGGSSLASEVMRAAIGVAPGFPRFRVLDSVDPEAVRDAMAQPATTLFILASKSGSTIELISLSAEAERRLRAESVHDVGSHFVAITDDNTVLQRQAANQRFRDLFINPSDIGGRFSALSLFGLVPAAVMGIDIDALLATARDMAGQCRIADPESNPGLALGALIGAASIVGRDKLTLVLPASLERFGLWAEQLIAESTGKHGKGIVPVAESTFDVTRAEDRVVVAVTHSGASDTSFYQEARASHMPVVTLRIADGNALGAEFFRWEVATATAGWLLDINPFDEPNVQQAKDATRALLAGYAADHRLPVREPDAAIEGARIVRTAQAIASSHDGQAHSLGLLDLLRPRDYFALLAYLPPDDTPFLPTLNRIRSKVAEKAGCATMLGFGPRYLHSTGQLHKGGPNTGVFLIITAGPSEDLPVPGEPYSFGVLEMAQALGDFESLERTGRRAVHVHLPRRDPSLLERVAARILGD